MATIRRADSADIQALLPLIAEYWRFEEIDGFEPRRVAEQLGRVLADQRLGAGWIALLDDTPVGYLLAVYVFSLEHLGITAEIDELFVLPEQRGMGAGVKLLRAAEEEFVRVGCTNVSLQLARHNSAARSFYHRHGYRERAGFELLDKML
jgi:GNAT superfamily N-acetyltransferase